MQKALVLFLVATLLLAGCTELLDSEDGETMKIEINEDIAFEKINDFMTVDEGESFGITMMQEMDSNALVEMGVAVLDEDSDEDSDVMGTVEMTQAWSPDGYHTSRIMGIGNESSSIKMVSSMTQIGTTIYMEMGYEKLGDLCADEEEQEDIEDCKEEMASLTEVKAYSMTTTTTHTEIIAAMAEDTQNDGDDMNMMEMLEVFTFTECMGVFTPSTETVDGLQIFDVTMEDMEDSMTPDMALCLFDTDNSDSISFEEFTASDDTEEGDVDEMRTVFDNADANANGELDSTELVTFIESMDSLEDEEEQMQDEDQSGEMPDMSVAFNNAGEIEYFGMSIDGNEVKMFVLTDKGVESIFANVDAGELVALPFYIGNEYDMDESDDEFMCNDGSTIPMSFVNDGDEDCDGGEDEDDMGGSDDEFMCNDGTTIPMNYVNDGDEDCAGGEDEDDMGGSDGNTFYIETSQDVMIPFEGDMSDYKIELTTCRDDYNPDTMGYDTTCGESVMSIAISDAGENSDIMFHDTDNSGTISVGDMIHIGETTGEWNTVRLYSISADAYSDENPIYNTPGFTGLVGMLALLGAAFIRRNE